MGLAIYGQVLVHGNFEERTDSKPKDFDYMSDAKWYEPYPESLERIKIGKTTCDCKRIKTDFQPYYGFSWFHDDKCSLILRVKERPGLANLPAFWNVETIGHSY